jgi:hypothetical protein
MKPVCLWWVYSKNDFCRAEPVGFRLSFPSHPDSAWVYVCGAHKPAELILTV